MHPWSWHFTVPQPGLGSGRGHSYAALHPSVRTPSRYRPPNEVVPEIAKNHSSNLTPKTASNCIGSLRPVSSSLTEV